MSAPARASLVPNWGRIALICVTLGLAVAIWGSPLRRPVPTAFELEHTPWPDYPYQRKAMVQTALEFRGVVDPVVQRAFYTVPRERFAAPQDEPRACHDVSLALPDGRFVLEPYAIVYMATLAEVRASQRVLVVAAASGYEAAIVAAMGARVWAVESDAGLAARARRALSAARARVPLRCGSVAAGWPEHGPYDAILVLPPATPPLPGLLAQLGSGGRLVFLEGTTSGRMQRIVHAPGGDRREQGEAVRISP